jgi:hypothetical protein
MATRLQRQHWTWAHRLMLAAHAHDRDAALLIAHEVEVDGCPYCWQTIAYYLALLSDLTTKPADREDRIDALFGGLQFALDTGDHEILELGDPDEEGDAA